ncbi:hypothetical protein EK904_013274 [Melospiza melodia maxima]|nr:hypothetical protein EK904_013274 [Melospiza melodia maxima]
MPVSPDAGQTELMDHDKIHHCSDLAFLCAAAGGGLTLNPTAHLAHHPGPAETLQKTSMQGEILRIDVIHFVSRGSHQI